jgi:hypothetical protein
MAVVSGLLYLAETQSSAGRTEEALGGEDEPRPDGAQEDRMRGDADGPEGWGQAADLAVQIERRTYRSQTLFQVVESLSSEVSRLRTSLGDPRSRTVRSRSWSTPAW